MVMRCLRFFQQVHLNGKFDINNSLKQFDLNKYTSNSSKQCVIEVDLEYSKELRELHNDYSLAPDKIEIQRKMLLDYQLNIADLYSIPIGNVKKLVVNVYDK